MTQTSAYTITDFARTFTPVPFILAASASFLAILNATLLFVRGTIIGAEILLGRGAFFFACSVTFDSENLDVSADAAPLDTLFTDIADVERDSIPACECIDVRDVLLERLFADPGSFGVVGCRNMNDVGGALSFCARNDEVLFVLGAKEGRLLSEGTLIVSRLLWPGTPSKIAAVFGFVPLAVGGVVFLGASGSGIPSLNEAALVMRGLIAGAFVEATWIVSVRLWPGTLAKVFASCSLDTGTRCLFSEGARTIPARNAAALVVRGTMSGDAWDAGRPRALN